MKLSKTKVIKTFVHLRTGMNFRGRALDLKAPDPWFNLHWHKNKAKFTKRGIGFLEVFVCLFPVTISVTQKDSGINTIRHLIPSPSDSRHFWTMSQSPGTCFYALMPQLWYSHRYHKPCGWRTRHTDVLQYWRMESEDVRYWQVQCAVGSSSHGQHRLSNIFIHVFFILCVWVFYLHVYLCTACMSGTLRDQKRATDLSKLGLQRVMNCNVGAGNPAQVLRKSSQSSLSPKPSL